MGNRTPNEKSFVPSSVRVALSKKIPEIAVDEWGLLYCTSIHGRSFNQMVNAIANKGSTILFVKIENDSGEKITSIIGGYNKSPWLLVSQREQFAKSQAAAIQRAKRNGQDYDSLISPTSKSSMYFGTNECKLFRADVDEKGEVVNIRVYSPSGPKSNFMYLFDTHPNEDHLGIGMGGEFGKWVWFVDKWLENGSCNDKNCRNGPLQRCQTFGTMMLGPSTAWLVADIEAYTVDKEVIKDLKQKSANKPTLIIDKEGADADKMILELDNKHTFNNCE